jgi:hypothetical protein
MKLWLDCEWNEFGGELISMALIDENNRCWYEVLPCPNPGPWVKENVIPVLRHSDVVSYDVMQRSLWAFLLGYSSVHIIADWPEDIIHFCKLLITGPGMRFDTPPLTMEVVRLDGQSSLPHNALADALAIKKAYLAVESNNDN